MTDARATNITWHEGHVTRAAREEVLRQKGATLWFTGLSGSGKSTTAYTVEHALTRMGRLAYVLDGDNVRHGLCRNLGFSPPEREENIRRVAEVAKLFADAGVILLTAFISPYRKDRDLCRELHARAGLPFLEVHMATPIATCEARDPKGLYRKARAGEITGFTGIDDPYEPPADAELTIDAAALKPDDAARLVIDHLRAAGIVPA